MTEDKYRAEIVGLMRQARTHIGGAEREMKSMHTHFGSSTHVIEEELKAALRCLAEITKHLRNQP